MIEPRGRQSRAKLAKRINETLVSKPMHTASISRSPDSNPDSVERSHALCAEISLMGLKLEGRPSKSDRIARKIAPRKPCNTCANDGEYSSIAEAVSFPNAEVA